MLLLAVAWSYASLCQGASLMQLLLLDAVPEVAVLEQHWRCLLPQLLAVKGKAVVARVPGRLPALALPARRQVAPCGAALLAAQLPFGLMRGAGHGYHGGLPAASHSDHDTAARTAFSSAYETEQLKGLLEISACFPN